METGTTTRAATRTETDQAAAFERLGGICALLAAVGSLLYSVAFVILKDQTLYSSLLLVGGILTTAVLTGVYFRVRDTDTALSLWALLLGVGAALGSAAHGGFDLANVLSPNDLATQATKANAPSQIDPRGLLTFGVAGLALLLFSTVIVRGGRLPRALGFLGIVLGLLLVEIYLGRLIVVNPASQLGTALILAPAAAVGLAINPIFNVWLGLALLRRRTT